MNENISLGRIFGIHVGFNWSLLVVAALIAWSLATGILPPAAPGQTSSAYWTAGVVSAFVFLASLLAHELAHSVVAVRRGVKVEGITLWLFGGVSRFSSETNSPGSQALITFVGPLTSLVLGVVFYLVCRLLSRLAGGTRLALARLVFAVRRVRHSRNYHLRALLSGTKVEVTHFFLSGALSQSPHKPNPPLSPALIPSAPPRWAFLFFVVF